MFTRSGVGPLFMIMKLAQSREDARIVVDALAAVRSSLIRAGKIEAFDSRLAALFAKVWMLPHMPVDPYACSAWQ